jgi:hypothetical protein
MSVWLAIVVGVSLGCLIAAYVRFLLYPIAQETVTFMAQRRSSQRLSQHIDRGTIRLDSPEYWAAIEAMASGAPDNKSRSTAERSSCL